MTHDVIIIGSGPGGAVCGRELAAMSHKVLILEKKQRGAYKPNAGGISPRNCTITALPDSIIEHTVDSGFFCTASGRTFTITAEDDVAYIVPRSKFDKYLQDLAVKAGAEVRHNVEVKNITFERDRVEIFAETEKGEVEYSAKAVVGAFGISGRNLFDFFGVQPPQCSNAVISRVKLPEAPDNKNFGRAIEIYLDTKITAGGIAWIYPRRGGAAVCISSCLEEEDKPLKEKMLDFMNNHPVASERLTGWEPHNSGMDNSVCEYLIPRLPIKKSYGHRFVLVGDAAGAANPLTGEGVYYAQRTGFIASRVLHKCIETNSFCEEKLVEYESRWRRAVVVNDTDYNRKTAELLIGCPHQDEVVEALLEAAESNDKVREAVLWVFTGLRSQREAMMHAASPRLIFQIIQKLSIKAAPMIPRILKTYKLSDLI